MKDAAFLTRLIRQRNSILCVGLDPDMAKIPVSLDGDLLAFNQAIIDATRDECVAFKPNFAFYEILGSRGWDILEKTIAYIGDDHLIIADAKRGDIGNTSSMYARAVFDHLRCDAITVSPYMGHDSVQPFFREGKWVIVLALTSNSGSHDFQQLELTPGLKMYEAVMQKTTQWGHAGNTMFVVGATHPSELAHARQMFPDHFFLLPGVGAQGADVDAVCTAGLNRNGGLLINASRSILYAGDQADFAQKAREEAARLNQSILPYLTKAMATP